MNDKQKAKRRELIQSMNTSPERFDGESVEGYITRRNDETKIIKHYMRTSKLFDSMRSLNN